jgi:Domain of unknown function (DUF4157)
MFCAGRGVGESYGSGARRRAVTERLLRGDAFEHDRSRREDFDPIAEGKRYGLAPDVSAAIWEHARREATNHHGVCDEDLARERFTKLANRVAERGGRPGAAPFHWTQVDVASSAAPTGDVLAALVPGRTTRVLARVSDLTGIAFERDRGRTTLSTGQVDSDVSTPEDSRGFFQRYVNGGHAARSKLEHAIASRDHYAALVAIIALKQDLKSARQHLTNGLGHDEGLRAELAALEGPVEQLLASVPNMSAGDHPWELWGPDSAEWRAVAGAPTAISEPSGTAELVAATDLPRAEQLPPASGYAADRDELPGGSDVVRAIAALQESSSKPATSPKPWWMPRVTSDHARADGERRAQRRDHDAPASDPRRWRRPASPRVAPVAPIARLMASPRVAPAAPIARLATGTVAITSERALELAAHSTGRPLSIAMQYRFAYLFDHGFEHVQLHTDAAARQACEALAARGFTIGSHVFVALDEQQLETPAGGDLLQHELAHVVQHDRGHLAGAPARVTEPGDAVERAAHQLVEATQPQRERLEARSHALAPRQPGTALSAPAGALVAPVVIARDALGTLHGTDLAVSVEDPGLSVHVLLTLTAQQAQRFQADASLATRLAQDFAHTLSPGGQPRFEGRAFLESSAITSRLTRDIGAWLEGRGLPQTTGFLDQRAQALGRLNLLAPLERTLATRGIVAGSIDWAAVGPTLLAEQPRPASTLIEASVQDRYHLFLRAIMTEAASRPAVVGATTTAAQLAPTLHDYVDRLDSSEFGGGVSVYSEAFLARWTVEVGSLRYTPDGFDVERFRPTTSAATLEAERHRVLDDFKRTRMPNLVVAYVRDQWSGSMQTPDGFLAHVDMAALRQAVVTRMVDEYMHLAASDPGYRAALRNATHDQARFDAIRTLFTLATAMQHANHDLAIRLTTTPAIQLGTADFGIAEDPFAYYRTAAGVSQATMAMFTTLQRGGDLGAAFAALPDIEATATVTSVAALVALIAQLRTMRSLHEQQEAAVRDDLRTQIDLQYEDVVHIVQTMWDDAEAYIRTVYIPKLKEVAIRQLTANRDELARWHDHWDTETPRMIASYRIAAFGLEDAARRLRSGEATSVELQGQTLTLHDVAQVDHAATTLRGFAARLESREGADEKRRQLAEALAVFDRTRERIRDGTYPPYLWGGAVASIARQELGIGEFPEYTTYRQVFTGRVQASQNPFLARAIAGWQFRERLEAEFRQVSLLVGLGMLTIASILAPGVGGLILTAIDIAVNIGVAAHGVVEARRALDLALLDPHLELQGVTVEQARSALNHAWIGLALSILIPAGIAAFTGAMVWRMGRMARRLAREMPHLHAANQADPMRVERLLRLVPDAAHLDRLLGLVTDAQRLERMLFHAGDGTALERLLRRVPDTVRLANWLERAGTAERMVAILDRTSGAAQIDALAATYGDRFLLLESHLAVAGADARAGARLQALLEHAGGPQGFSRLLTQLGSATEQTAFLRAIESNPARGVALARAMAPAPGLAARMARHMGTNLLAHLSVEGSALRIHNELVIAPEALMTVSEADLPVLLRACENPAAHAADIGRFEGGIYRFRFRSSVAARVDPWVATMLREAGVAEGTPAYAMFQRMSEADRQGLWDLPNNRGRDPGIRPQAARWALGRQTDSVHQFVADFQFYVGEVDHQRDLIEMNLRARSDAALHAAEAANGGRPLSSAQREQVFRSITQQAPAPSGQGGLGRPFPNLDGEGVKRAMRQRAVHEMGEPGAGGRAQGAIHADAASAEAQAHLTGAYAVGETRVAGAIDPSTLAARARDQVTTLHFSDPETAAYHAHVHTREIPPADLVPGANEVESYLNTAREGVRSGTPSAPVRRQDGAWSISFSRGRGVTIVNVTPEGVATIATYIPGRSP